MPAIPPLALSGRRYDYPLSYGTYVASDGVMFLLFSRHATGVRLLIYDDVAATEPAQVFTLMQESNRWGDVWHAFIPGLKSGALYHYQVDGEYEPTRGMRFDGRLPLIDPYAEALAGEYQFSSSGILVPPKCVVVDGQFDWQQDRHLRRPLGDSIIYEMNVRGLTCSKTSGCEFPGTYRGVIEKIPYLQSLGVTTVELMPVHEFMEQDPYAMVRAAKKGKTPSVHGVNYWGYNTVCFFAPHRKYSSNPTPGASVFEFKQMVRALHQAGIEVILDVVFNHTAEGNEQGPTLSFKGLENTIYYMLEPNDLRKYKNYSGCGNTVNGNHPIVRSMIFDCLRFWVHNYHVDGFRFDLASILSRDRNGNLVTDPPLIELIAEDPMLADTKLIAEAWDAAGAYQVGSFGSLRWAEWNGRYRDDVRRFWRGDSGMTNHLATRLAGSSDLYQSGGRSPYHSINFITSHDGFSLNDLVSYNSKHNEANGENNRDGDNCNFSNNCGVEGPTSDPAIEKLRLRKIKNMLATLLCSQGVPMLRMGDECRLTQHGNNNAYCQDNELSWFDWNLLEQNAELLRFCKGLIKLRRNESTLRHLHFLTGRKVNPNSVFPDVSWYQNDGRAYDWSNSSNTTLVCLFAAKLGFGPNGIPGKNHVLLIFNASSEPQQFTFASELHRASWRLFMDTAAESPADIYPDFDGPRVDIAEPMELAPFSMRCCLSQVHGN